MTAPVLITLSPLEAAGLLALASKGRVFLDVDPAFLTAHARRSAARQGLARLRLAVNTHGTPA